MNGFSLLHCTACVYMDRLMQMCMRAPVRGSIRTCFEVAIKGRHPTRDCASLMALVSLGELRLLMQITDSVPLFLPESSVRLFKQRCEIHPVCNEKWGGCSVLTCACAGCMCVCVRARAHRVLEVASRSLIYAGEMLRAEDERQRGRLVCNKSLCYDSVLIMSGRMETRSLSP